MWLSLPFKMVPVFLFLLCVSRKTVFESDCSSLWHIRNSWRVCNHAHCAVWWGLQCSRQLYWLVSLDVSSHAIWNQDGPWTGSQFSAKVHATFCTCLFFLWIGATMTTAPSCETMYTTECLANGFWSRNDSCLGEFLDFDTSLLDFQFCYIFFCVRWRWNLHTVP